MGKSVRKWQIFMLIGEYNHMIDAKGRLIVPVKFRDELGQSFVVTRGLGSCLTIYPMKEWERLTEKIAELPITNERSRNFKRYMLSGACECELDKMGRILIPQNLRASAGLTKEVVLAGQDRYIEIWDKDKWDSVKSSFDDIDTLAETWEGLSV